ncbi:FAD-dependent monooxygenase [Ancylobacter pratisalsi]|uniref:NAD(P)-binding protein n=1 Tax=Ancylobacter pratisalsi TaxID=1745854 RepID=A0A6P1YS22_9HYPH|nr:FAD-dependent monooxygenase [Ancylobacter pratisalsi]QIB35591.1 NAD(P)-binding protein [Ancylobacter pratisalsi]
MTRRPIAIAGAGIGGLTAAIALARAGFEVEILERAHALEEAGAGVQLAANATRCLASLGLYERVAANAVTPTGFAVMDGRRGAAIAQAPMGAQAEARFGGPFIVIHRADLQAALLGAAREIAGITLHLDRAVEGFEAAADGVSVHSHDGRTLQAQALIGADGLRSRVRQHLRPGARPVFRHRAAWRATVPAHALPAALATPVTRLWLGPGAHLVSYPVKSGTAINLVAVTPDERPVHGWSLEGAPDELLAHYRDWSPDARALLGAPERWLRWALFDLDPMPAWGQSTEPGAGTGPVTLLGDAAHAMPPFLAQGAAQAIEDAVVLARCLKDAPDASAALARYEGLRLSRTAAVQRAARSMDRIYHLSGPARMARDLVMRARAGSALLERYRWIYGWSAETA